MQFKTVQASALKSSFEVLKDVINDVNMYFNSDGMTITALDNAKVALINMKLHADKFEEYECEEPVTAGVNITNFFKILKFITSNDVLEIEITDKEIMKISISNDTKNSNTKFELSLLWINDDVLEIPVIEPSCTTVITSVDFQRICRDMGNLSSDVTIFRNKNLLNISCKGDFAKQETSIDTEQTEFTEAIGNRYSLKYINLFTKATNMCSHMKIQQTFPTEKIPIIFVYDVANLGFIEFFLAAKLDD
jgi:proliferating cell nuclear antigen